MTVETIALQSGGETHTVEYSFSDNYKKQGIERFI